jgi:hypothetical protein
MAAALLALMLFLPEAPIDAAKAQRDNDNYTAAILAAMQHFAAEGKAEHLDTLLRVHPDLVNSRTAFRGVHKPSAIDAYTCLHFAAEGGHTSTVTILLNHVADVNARARGGWTPLHMAAREGHLNVVKLLVERRADVYAKTDAVAEYFGVMPGSDGHQKPQKFPAIPAKTPLDMARGQKHADVVKFLSQAMERTQDNREYKTWAAFKVGTTIRWRSGGTNSNLPEAQHMSTTGRTTLLEITPAKVVVETVSDAADAKPGKREIPAKIEKVTFEGSFALNGKSRGTEEFRVGERTYTCDEVPYNAPLHTFAVWECDKVPGGRVKTHSVYMHAGRFENTWLLTDVQAK